MRRRRRCERDLTYHERELVKIIVCFVDPADSYMAFLVQGIDYAQVPRRHNLYLHAYVTVYEHMQDHGLTVFDMARGYAQQKANMGANVFEPLHTWLKPLDDQAAAYVELIAGRAEVPSSGAASGAASPTMHGAREAALPR